MSYRRNSWSFKIKISNGEKSRVKRRLISAWTMPPTLDRLTGAFAPSMFHYTAGTKEDVLELDICEPGIEVAVGNKGGSRITFESCPYRLKLAYKEPHRSPGNMSLHDLLSRQWGSGADFSTLHRHHSERCFCYKAISFSNKCKLKRMSTPKFCLQALYIYIYIYIYID